MAVPHCYHRAFLRNLETLEEAIIDPGGLATKLYSKGLIDNLARQRAQLQSATTLERSRELVQKLEAKIKKEEATFDEFLSVLDDDPTMEELCRKLRATADKALLENTVHSPKSWKCMYQSPGNVCINFMAKFVHRSTCAPSGIASRVWLIIGAILILIAAVLWVNLDCYQLGTCYSRSLPHIDNFVGREEDIRNITGYLDFDHSKIQVVHIVGPPGFGKSTLAKKIGHMLLRKGVKVNYADIREVTDMDGLAEKIMLSIIDSPKYKITFDRLEKWVHKQYSKTLLILDNCDEMFEASKEEFLRSIKKLMAPLTVRYLLTSQRWIADIGNFRLHQIYNLSSEAASQLLGKLAPSLTEYQKIQIAELTGNVPLALDVIGAIFNFPNAPTVDEVIKRLKDDPMDILSPHELPEYSTVFMSIHLAYSYLSPELQELCLNLSYFPGSFDKEGASFISYHRDAQLDILVRRSLLHVNYYLHMKRYHFHQLIRSFFLHIPSQKRESLQQNFENRFQYYFAVNLDILIEYRGAKYLELVMLDVEKHNLQYMFNLFKTAKHVNYTLFGVNKTVVAMQTNLLQLRFTLTELCDISQNMLMVLESYTTDEEASEELFLEIYTQLVIQAAKLERQLHTEATFAIEILSPRENKIGKGYEEHLVRTNTYIQYYTDLAQYYKDNGEEEKSIQCHVHILEHVHNLKCHPTCDYYSISVAYERIGESAQAFQFRELAYEHQLSSLSLIQQAKLYLDLYNDYTSWNNPSKADFFSNEIIEKVYVYLIIANGDEYSKEIYFDAVDFFRAKDMKEHMVSIQYIMKDVILSKCVVNLNSCAKLLLYSFLDAWKRRAYHLTIELSLIVEKKILHLLTIEDRAYIAEMIGESYYHIGNYSESQVWLRRAQQIKHSETQQSACRYLIQSGDYFNIICYGYLVKGIMNELSAQIIKLVYCTGASSQHTLMENVRETGLTEVKYSYIWVQFEKVFYEFKCTIKKHISSAKWIIIQFQNSCLFSVAILLLLLFFICSVPIVSFIGVLIIADVMSAYCTERQIRCCFSCATFCIFLGIFSTIAMFVFVLSLDVLYY